MQKTITLNYHQSIDELGEAIKTLIRESQKATSRAYTPYSNFKIGAAVLLANDVHVLGCNQENRAFPSGLCAERAALFSAGSQYPNTSILAMAVFCETTKPNEMISPCGGCRQVMFEFEQKQDQPYPIYLCNQDESVWISPSAENLLPFPFVASINDV